MKNIAHFESFESVDSFGPNVVHVTSAGRTHFEKPTGKTKFQKRLFDSASLSKSRSNDDFLMKHSGLKVGIMELILRVSEAHRQSIDED
jgi:hypothetical protein